MATKLTSIDRRVLLIAGGLFITTIMGTVLSHLLGFLPPLSPLQQSQFINSIILSLVENIRLLAALTVLVLVAHFVRNKICFVRAMKFFSYSALIASILIIYEFLVKLWSMPLPLFNDKSVSSGSIRTFGTFYEPTSAGVYLLMCLFATLIVISLDKKSFKNGKIILIIIMVAMMTTFSKTAFIAGTVGYLVVISSSLSLLKITKRIILLLLLIFPIVISYHLSEKVHFLIDHSLVIFTKSESDIEAGRNFAQRVRDNLTLTIPFNNPVFGIGNGLSAVYVGNYPLYLRIFLEYGVVGTLIFIYLAAIGFAGVLKSRLNKEIENAWPFMMGMLVSYFLFLFNYPTLNDGWLWFCMGMFIMAGKLEKSSMYKWSRWGTQKIILKINYTKSFDISKTSKVRSE